MAIQFMDSFDHYGVGAPGGENMLDGIYAAAGTESAAASAAAPVEPSFGARTGLRCFRIEAFPGTRTGSGDGNQFRKALTTARDEVFVAFALNMETLPPIPDRYCCLGLRDANNARIAEIMVRTNGALQVVNGPFADEGGTPNILVQTSGPVIAAGQWNHFEIRCVVSTGTIEVRQNENTIMTATGLSLGSQDVASVIAWSINMGFQSCNMYIDDLVISDAEGTLNNSWNGDVRVATLYPDTDGATSGWTSFPRQKIGNDIGFISSKDGLPVIRRASPDDTQTDMDVGTGDYTFEGFVRFWKLPDLNDQATLFAHWNSVVPTQRGWRLYKGGDNVKGGQLVFECSTDGTVDGIVEIHAVTWEPRIGQWYHVAVCRNSGTNRLFIDGVQRGADVADSNNYYLPTNDACEPTIGAQQASSKFSAQEPTIMEGFWDEVRFTVGVGRYTANFTPTTTAYPRNLAGDPDYNSTVTLLGFEDTDGDDVIDGSFAAVDWDLAGASAEVIRPEDLAHKYLTVAEDTPIDDNYVAADFIAATAQLILSSNPLTTETVVVGGTTYTFVTALSTGPTVADEVLIGADRDESIANLIAAVNGGAGEGTTYSTGTVVNPDATALETGNGEITFTATSQGVGGNSTTSTTTVTGGNFENGSTFTGGLDIPGPQDFLLGPLPPLTTQVRGIQFTPRLSKVDAGSAEIQMSFRNVQGDSVDGAVKTLTTAASYYTDIIEQDPATLGALTPTSIQTGIVRINRTT